MLHWQRIDLALADSTNEEVRRRAESGAPEGLVIRADAQTAGRGRRGRAWASQPGNLYVSLLLRPRRDIAEVATLSFLTAVAVAEAVEQAGAAAGIDLAGRVRCKWPNDVMLDGAKLCGILLESRTGPDGRLDYLIVGVGVNLTTHPDGLPYPATHLGAAGVALPPGGLLDKMLTGFAVWYERWHYEGFAPVRAAWLQRAQGLGGPVVVRTGETEVRGIFSALDASGALVLELPNGQRQSVTAGDVFPAT